ncbi:hypothetical protein [Bradyrhizobium archetypum]|nr:hypothetical protein [Bradyrhizobium archetypum]
MKDAKNLAHMSISPQTTISIVIMMSGGLGAAASRGRFLIPKREYERSSFPGLGPHIKACTMNTPDEDTVLKAIEDARRILGEYIAPGPRDAAQTVHRLLAVLDREAVVRALDRIKQRRTLRLVE